jgi:GAF domain-containing protein
MSGKRGERRVAERPIPPELASAFSELSELLLSRETPESTLRLIAALVVRVIPGCDGAGVSVIAGRRILTVAQTDETAERVDQIQRETGQGPCIVAATQQDAPASVIVDDMQAESRWPDYANRVSAIGVGSMIAFPLRADELLGSLNLYATKPHAFTQEDGAVGAVFAAHAAVALANAQTHAADTREIESLRIALDTRSVISQAVGILMEREQISSDQAFQRLSTLSQHLNRKLRDVAQDVLRFREQGRID